MDCAGSAVDTADSMSDANSRRNSTGSASTRTRHLDVDDAPDKERLDVVERCSKLIQEINRRQ
jgi:hypothetical protein